ncbi:zinc transporter subunit: membrane component of ABC superfamily [Magnetospirillum sp. LM-5]|uniref:iron chelate uptake ABC transporter family permease subunit n=1 Tax=Magnetospirillum sp. LM-5 TaxID=2681466 RepID=UPI00137FCB05|nr:iron chelate uptake ABC transporter family permease subunit [Magnetospirillum sp. LM-5]CAA7617826.1 zinc transporter subunit: membrane component of ABC superfamily [Magnetospirillum sp. LM-5]
MDEFLIKALAAGIGLALVAAPFGCFVVWRRMAYFGDTLAHAALLGVVASLLLGTLPLFGIAFVAVAAAILLAQAQRQDKLGSDTILGIVSHGSLAAGLVALSQVETVRVDLMGWLLGDILAVTWGDVGLIWGGGALMLTALALVWRPLLAATIDPDLATIEGHAVERARMILMVLVALVVAVAMKVVGVLLVTALLVIPAATARGLSRTPEQMAAFAALVGMVAVGSGLAASWHFDSPAGPSVVVAAVIVFLAARLVRRY